MNFDLTQLYPIIASVLVALLGLAMQKLASYLDERKQASMVSRVAMAISTVSGNVLNEMLLHPGAPADTLRQVQQQAIRQGVAYVQTRLPDTLKALGGVDPRTLEAMIAGAIGNRAGATVLGGEVIAPKGAMAAPDAGVSAASVAPMTVPPGQGASGGSGRVRLVELGQEPVAPLADAVAATDPHFGPRADAT